MKLPTAIAPKYLPARLPIFTTLALYAFLKAYGIEYPSPTFIVVTTLWVIICVIILHACFTQKTAKPVLIDEKP